MRQGDVERAALVYRQVADAQASLDLKGKLRGAPIARVAGGKALLLSTLEPFCAHDTATAAMSAVDARVDTAVAAVYFWLFTNGLAQTLTAASSTHVEAAATVARVIGYLDTAVAALAHARRASGHAIC